MIHTCAIEGCGRKSYARGWCKTHYMRWRAKGDPLAPNRPRPSAETRFLAKIVEGPSGCWLWTGTTLRGYGQFGIGSKTDGTRRMTYAHRWAYEHFVGPIPDDLQLDHLCRVPACVNPAHLEPVTQLENQRRGKKARQTHCVRGHEYTPENTGRNSRGCRLCKTCRALLRRERSRTPRLTDALSASPPGSAPHSPLGGDAFNGTAGLDAEPPQPRPAVPSHKTAARRQHPAGGSNPAR